MERRASYGTARADALAAEVLAEHLRAIQDEEAAIARFERLAARIDAEVEAARDRRDRWQRAYDLARAALQAGDAR